MSGEAALRLLMEGNKRYAAERCEHPNHMASRRLAVAKGQHPFAIVLTCADSRVARVLTPWQRATGGRA